MSTDSTLVHGDDAYIPGPSGHFCQIHQEEHALVQAVVKFLAAGATNGEGVLLVTRKGRQQLIVDWLTAKLPSTARLHEDGHLQLISSNELLDSVAIDGMPHWGRFEALVGQKLSVATDNGRRRARIYGDAVSELWQLGSHAAAVELEACWNRLLPRFRSAKVYCAYLIDALDERSYSEHLRGLGHEHSIVSAGKDQINLMSSLQQASRELLGQTVAEAGGRWPRRDWRNQMPLPMQSVLWLLENKKEIAADVLRRARELYATHQNG